MRVSVTTFLLAASLALTAAGALAAAERSIVVNHELLGRDALELVELLEARFGIRVADGRYWYDPYSGLWGFEGTGAQGQTLAGLPLGGPLRSDASGGRTGVFVNGRQLHASEVLYLSRCLQVIPGQYWMNERGVGGALGGPPIFDLPALCRRATGGGSRATGGHSWYGSVLGDGETVGYISGGLGVTCGPDGGCLY